MSIHTWKLKANMLSDRLKLLIFRIVDSVFSNKVFNPRSLFLKCKNQNMDTFSECGNDIKYSLTNQGICISYNGLPIDQTLQKSEYSDQFNRVFKNDKKM